MIYPSYLLIPSSPSSPHHQYHCYDHLPAFTERCSVLASGIVPAFYIITLLGILEAWLNWSYWVFLSADAPGGGWERAACSWHGVRAWSDSVINQSNDMITIQTHKLVPNPPCLAHFGDTTTQTNKQTNKKVADLDAYLGGHESIRIGPMTSISQDIARPITSKSTSF